MGLGLQSAIWARLRGLPDTAADSEGVIPLVCAAHQVELGACRGLARMVLWPIKSRGLTFQTLRVGVACNGERKPLGARSFVPVLVEHIGLLARQVRGTGLVFDDWPFGHGRCATRRAVPVELLES